MVKLCASIANNETFQSFIFALIVLSALMMGAETVQELRDSFGDLFFYFFLTSQAIFIGEIIVRVGAFGAQPRRFFDSFWNTFDFAIVVLTLIPFVGPFAIVARLLRVLRVLRVFSTSRKLRSFAARLHQAVDEVAYSILIIAVLGYIFSISGYYLFSETDLARWGSLGRSALSVFYLLLLQDVAGIVEPALAVSRAHIIFFVVFYVVHFGLLLSVLIAGASQSNEDPRD
jgi:voltage-gated sodium channel